MPAVEIAGPLEHPRGRPLLRDGHHRPADDGQVLGPIAQRHRLCLGHRRTLARAGIRHFWSKGVHFAPRLRAAEGGAVLILLLAAFGLTIYAEPVMRYATATATAMHAPRAYIDAVLSARPRPGPTTPAAGPDVPVPDDGSATP